MLRGVACSSLFMADHLGLTLIGYKCASFTDSRMELVYYQPLIRASRIAVDAAFAEELMSTTSGRPGAKAIL
jgi:hypothetical protein